jgi:hypothetical protein
MWSPVSINLNYILDTCFNFVQVQVLNTIYGSNGHIEQPNSIVAGFTKRGPEPTRQPGLKKYFIRSDVEWETLGVHYAKPVDDSNWSKSVLLGPEYFVLNHYCCQSFNFWRDVKCTRGDSDNYRVRTIEDMKEIDLNETEDTRLLEQNRPILFPSTE